jgi:hypothetical protein
MNRSVKSAGVLAALGIAVLATTGAKSSGCDNDGIGHKGTVKSRFHSGTVYQLTIRDEQRGTLTFSVPKSQYKDCSPGEYFPGCKTHF